jgi:hypothetical protein
LNRGWKSRNLHYGLALAVLSLGSAGCRKTSNAVAEPHLRLRLPFQTKWEFFESTYGIDNNRESAT